ncbi:MAG: exodeoxyribonuclease I [Desulfocapsa sp.]|nr:exodeoxyribonuclease I [Desulfocapsa sp.]
MTTTLYWHDYETWGADPRRDRPAQFAGIRTDTQLNIIGKPLVHYCKPALDMLPQPEACMITGITPQTATKEGICEAEFMAEIHEQFIQPGTCGVGYNSLRFDDEFTRYGFYRNFFDPYAREWRNGNSRWDIIDMLRLTHALRPEGIEWPTKDDGVTSFRLEDLTRANNISHEGAHDALSDVYATIDLARLVRDRHPKLYDYLFDMRDKRKVGNNLNLQEQLIVLHVSSMYPAKQGCITPVIPLAPHPTNKNGIIVYDLRHDPEPLLTLSVEEIQKRLFTAIKDLPEGVERIPLKTIHINKCPVVVPISTLTPEAAERWQVDLKTAEKHALQLRNTADLSRKLQEVHGDQQFPVITDPDQNLYGGGFFSDRDRSMMDDIHDMSVKDLAKTRMVFEDPRLLEMLFRYRARNWPHSLSKEEGIRWNAFRKDRITNADADCGITLSDYRKQLATMVMQPDVYDRERKILSALADWPTVLGIS